MLDLTREAAKASLILAAAEIAAKAELPVSKHKTLLRALYHVKRAEDYFRELGGDVDLLDSFASFFEPKAGQKPRVSVPGKTRFETRVVRKRAAVESDSEIDFEEVFNEEYPATDKP